MPTPLGSHAPQLAAVRALKTKTGRREQGRFAVAGLTMLADGLESGRLPEAVYVTNAGLEELGALRPRLEGRLFVIAARAMERLSDLESAPGVLAVHRWTLESLESVLSDAGPIVVLGGIADPGNAGTLLRSAEAFGCRGAIFTDRAVEPYNAKVVRATMGAIFRLRLAVGEPREVRAAAARFGYETVVGDRGGCPLPNVRFRPRSLVVIGHERHGVGEWLRHADRIVAIPQTGRGESLNAAVAGAIILYAFSQQCADTSGGL